MQCDRTGVSPVADASWTGGAGTDIKEAKKRKIADAARELFTDFGYKSVSMDQIAQKANVAKGTVYLYFKDKDALFFYLADELLENIKTFVSSIVVKKLSLFDEIHQVVYNLLMLRTRQKFIYRIAREARELKTPSACSMMQMIEEQITGYIEEKLKEGIEQKSIKPCNTSVLAFVVVQVYSALAFEWEEKHEPLDEKQIAESVSLFLKDGLIVKHAVC
jgi:AcrR family transcriptional regulator